MNEKDYCKLMFELHWEIEQFNEKKNNKDLLDMIEVKEDDLVYISK